MFEEPVNSEQLGILRQLMFNMTVYSATLMMDVKDGHPAVRHNAKQIVDALRNTANATIGLTTTDGAVRKDDAFRLVFSFADVRKEILKLELLGYVVEVDNFDNENVRMSDYLAAEIWQFAETLG